MAVLESLGIKPTGGAPPMDRYKLLSGGELYDLPLGPAASTARSYLDARDMAQFDQLLARLAKVDAASLADMSIGQWLADHDLRPRVDSLARALFRLSTYVGDLDDLSADAAVAQQQAAARSGVIYVDDGWAQLVGALRSRVAVRSDVRVNGVSSDRNGAAVHTGVGTLTAGAVVLAAGSPNAVRSLLPDDPGWGALGEAVTAACLDVGVRRVPAPGYVVGLDEPLYATTQSPPARQAPGDGAVVAAIRYGARNADEDRTQLQAHLRELGVDEADVVVHRFLARMIVMSAMPRAETGGLRGRPSPTATGLGRVFLAGDWVGPTGLLADAALVSGRTAARAALRPDQKTVAKVA
jgi:hypothetical protein